MKNDARFSARSLLGDLAARGEVETLDTKKADFHPRRFDSLLGRQFDPTVHRAHSSRIPQPEMSRTTEMFASRIEHRVFLQTKGRNAVYWMTQFGRAHCK